MLAKKKVKEKINYEKPELMEIDLLKEFATGWSEPPPPGGGEGGQGGEGGPGTGAGPPGP